ncbi:MAG TPA: hypothetical protein VED87_07930 [Methylocystis sp.]|nr:hypothetical protein [Methylocystis sp.]
METPQRRTLLWAIVALLFLAGAAALRNVNGAQTISLSEQLIQERLNSRLDHDFPVSGAAALVVRSVRAESAQVHILDDEVEINAKVAGKLGNDRDFSFTVHTIGAPRYENGAFYFDPQQARVKDFVLAGGAGSENPGELGRRRLFGAIAQQLIEGNARQVEAWAAPVAEALAKHVMAQRPVYRLHDDFKGYVFKSSLESVKVADGHVDLTFTILGLGLAALAGAVCLVLALALAVALQVSKPSGAS